VTSQDDKAILLREALRRYLGREGFCDLIRGVLSGTIGPVGRDTSIKGILGSMFCIEDVKRYRMSRPNHAVPLGYMTYTVAAARLGTNAEVVRNLVAVGRLRCYRQTSGGLQLLRASEVEKFSSRYVTVKSIAERFKVGSRTVLKSLKRKGADVLAISLPGKGIKLFVRKGPKSDLTIDDLI
jgi:excisionase family DNA binding protein